ncbi:MAG: hypothetical protein KDJ99_16845, partial [Candidatus Competibacteraceae bacterium]|nr:hypothetical protein [Candidatus Competibacteraceae bacterium]
HGSGVGMINDDCNVTLIQKAHDLASFTSTTPILTPSFPRRRESRNVQGAAKYRKPIRVMYERLQELFLPAV